jgi:phosphate transport system substrate-binding protein
MNDEFLHQLRTPPSPAFAARLKRKLDSQAASSSSRRNYWLLGVLVVSILGSTAVAFVLPARNVVAVVIQKIAGAPQPPVAPASNGAPSDPPAVAASPPAAAEVVAAAPPDLVGPTAQVTHAAEPVVAAPSTTSISVSTSADLRPLAEAVDRALAKSPMRFSVQIVGAADSHAALLKLCTRESLIALSNRKISADEIEACGSRGVAYVELPIAYDATVLVVNPQNTWVDSLTLSELDIASKPPSADRVPLWYDMRSTWPTLPLTIYGHAPGKRALGEDESAVTQNVANNFGALGYVSFAEYINHSSELKSVAVVNHAGQAVLPSGQSIADGSYEPLSRPIFMYAVTSYPGNTLASSFVYQALQPFTWYGQSTGFVRLSDNDFRQATTKYVRARR